MGSSVITFLPVPVEIEYYDSFLQKMRLPYTLEVCKNDYCSIPRTIGIKGEIFQAFVSRCLTEIDIVVFF